MQYRCGKGRKVTSEDVCHDADQAVKTAAEYSLRTREEFQRNFNARLDKLDAKIAKLREEGSGVEDQAKANWDRKMAELKTKREATNANLAEVRHSSAEAWKDVRKGAVSAWNDLLKSFHDASKKF